MKLTVNSIINYYDQLMFVGVFCIEASSSQTVCVGSADPQISSQECPLATDERTNQLQDNDRVSLIQWQCNLNQLTFCILFFSVYTLLLPIIHFVTVVRGNWSISVSG